MYLDQWNRVIRRTTVRLCRIPFQPWEAALSNTGELPRGATAATTATDSVEGNPAPQARVPHRITATGLKKGSLPYSTQLPTCGRSGGRYGTVKEPPPCSARAVPGRDNATLRGRDRRKGNLTAVGRRSSGRRRGRRLVVGTTLLALPAIPAHRTSWSAAMLDRAATLTRACPGGNR